MAEAKITFTQGRTALPPSPVYRYGSKPGQVLTLLAERDARLGPRTVEAHVERMLAKTATANRRELARLAASAAVAGPAG